MTLITWQPQFNLNINIIDQQHQMLVAMINDLYEAFSSGKDRQILAKLINKLGVYAAMHFAREEHYFEVLSYPDSEGHLQEHSSFDEKVCLFEDDFNSGKQDLTINVLKFLSDWLVNHINGSDRKYAPFLKERGID
jgi:hemerythrin